MENSNLEKYIEDIVSEIFVLGRISIKHSEKEAACYLMTLIKSKELIRLVKKKEDYGEVSKN